MNVLVVGVNGQDGQLIARHLSRLGHRVTGIGRQKQPATQVTRHLWQYFAMEIGQPSNDYSALLSEVDPAAVFYLAAVHGPSGTQLESAWEALQATTVLGLHQTLEFARQKSDTRIVNFSSSRVFGQLDGKLISEKSPRHPDDLYGVVKNNADALVEYYFRIHNVKATSLVLFNHESCLRSSEFFSKKLVEVIYGLANGAVRRHSFVTFDFWKDWGLADEYMEIVARSFQQFKRPSYLLATGLTTHARRLVSDICQELEVDDTIVLAFAKAALKPKPISPYAAWTASPEALLQDTGLTPQIRGKEVFLRLLEELRDET